jgi:broad specificity phosphatase PhoE
VRRLRYLTHPQVRIDPAVPVPLWGLNDVGRARVEHFKSSSTLRHTSLIVSSAETKALETAAIIASHLAIPMHVREDAHENDRNATGFLPPTEFEKVADQFFAFPHESIRGWERAVDAQARIAKVCEDVCELSDVGDILMVGHGGVGSLLYCHLTKQPIARIRDQPPGGGNIFCFNMMTREMEYGWTAMEDIQSE